MKHSLPVIKITNSLLLLMFIGCATGTNKGVVPYGYSELSYDAGIAKKHVILIGLDGWGAYSLPKADMPVVKRMMQEGSYSLKTLGVLPSNSGPNWSSLFMGAGPGEHDYVERKNQAPAFQSPVKDRYGFFPTIFAALKAQRPDSSIGYFYEWDTMSYFCPDEVLDHKEYIPNLSTNAEAVGRIAEYIKTNTPSLTLIAFNEPDHAGHSKGHNTPAYYEKLNFLDHFIGIIEQGVKDAGIYEETIFILSADHGGIFRGHGGATLRERRIPLIFYGMNIKKNYKISQTPHIYDIAPTIAAIFKLDAPRVWKGKSIKEIFEDEDI